ncbi:hypothetical protein HYW94_03020 [Candidatus Uhrbacteria bacterium]|nr:hypothetical protein [Candidatus Uhrbacteria bacterium]
MFHAVYLDPVKVEQQPKLTPQPVPAEPDPTLTSYSITIRHGDNFAKRLKSLGCGKNVNDSITATNFPLVVDKAKGNETREVVVAHFNRYMSSEEVVDILNKLGYRPGTFEELIAFGADHPEVQRSVALGTVVSLDGERHVSCLSSSSSDRYLDRGWFDNDWNSVYRFLAVRMSA